VSTGTECTEYSVGLRVDSGKIQADSAQVNAELNWFGGGRRPHGIHQTNEQDEPCHHDSAINSETVTQYVSCSSSVSPSVPSIID